MSGKLLKNSTCFLKEKMNKMRVMQSIKLLNHQTQGYLYNPIVSDIRKSLTNAEMNRLLSGLTPFRRNFFTFKKPVGDKDFSKQDLASKKSNSQSLEGSPADKKTFFPRLKNSGIQPSNSPPKLSFQPTQKRKIAKVKKVLVVSSGKGGVGKSTISVNLAISLSKLSIRVGLLDLDIFGPSIPKLMNLENLTPSLNRDNALIPLRNHGISCMSIGFLLPQDSESRSNSMVAWRGMMVMKAVQQLLFDVDWSNSERSKECETISNDDSSLDVLVIDMPPGTGDVAISLGQLVEIDGAVIVTTPQDIALIDVTKGLNMFRKLNIPVIGTVLNMSSFTCPNCKSDLKIFGSTQSFENLLKSSGLVELGKVPLNIEINRSSDNGKPISTKSNFASSDPNTNIANNKGDLDCKNHIENGTYFDEISKKCFDSLFKPI